MHIERSWSLFGIAICIVAGLTAPFLTHPDYNWMRHTTGELAGQQMPNAWIMRVGYVSLGFGVFFDALQRMAKTRRDYIPFMIFGILMIGAGAFHPRSIDSQEFFEAPFAYWHGFLFILAEIALVVGMVWRITKSDVMSFRYISIALVSIYLASVPLIFFLPQYAGLIERVAFFTALGWLACFLHTVSSKTI